MELVPHLDHHELPGDVRRFSHIRDLHHKNYFINLQTTGPAHILNDAADQRCPWQLPTQNMDHLAGCDLLDEILQAIAATRHYHGNAGPPLRLGRAYCKRLHIEAAPRKHACDLIQAAWPVVHLQGEWLNSQFYHEFDKAGQRQSGESIRIVAKFLHTQEPHTNALSVSRRCIGVGDKPLVACQRTFCEQAL